ncbi:putative membrane protein [Methanohalophilus levihalophilus]|uniref:DUF1614 domain-containing protein n=1 Tax=Methanohalophilus levihalophilus TaxID=1431282 RepID=UPI001AEA99B9|nr:DUF1614 domain-containing protein [Methanohalophilus levihalophilus]MBP2029339.1 putative membrane protein [Methanohalophilus levihalophilus]
MRGFLNKTDYRHFAVYAFILLPTAALCYLGQLSLGTIPSAVLFGILLLIPIAGNVEIPVIKMRTRKQEHLQRDALVLEKIFSVPVVKELSSGTRIVFDTVVTINLGGFVIPLFLAAFLLTLQMNFVALEIALIVMVVVALVAEMIDGVGIVVPDYIGIIAIPFALLLDPINADIIVFVAGTMGVLAGTMAHLFALNKEERGSAFISIGGAGSFRAIYITVILAGLISQFI